MGAQSFSSRSANRTKSAKGRRAKHRAKQARRIEPFAWMGAGAITLGIGAAMASGAGVAHAEDGSSGSDSSSSSGASDTAGHASQSGHITAHIDKTNAINATQSSTVTPGTAEGAVATAPGKTVTSEKATLATKSTVGSVTTTKTAAPSSVSLSAQSSGLAADVKTQAEDTTTVPSGLAVTSLASSAVAQPDKPNAKLATKSTVSASPPVTPSAAIQSKALALVAVPAATQTPTAGSVTHTISFDPGTTVAQTIVSADGSQIYTLTKNAGDTQIIGESTSDNQFDYVADAPQITAFSLSPDGKKIYAASGYGASTLIQTFTADSTSITTLSTPSQSTQQLLVSPDGKKLYVIQADSSVASINTSTGVTTGTSPVLEAQQGQSYVLSYGAALSGDGKKLYVPDDGHSVVYTVNTASNSVVGQTSTTDPLFAAVSPDSKTLYVSSDSSIDVIDAQTGKVSRSIALDSGSAGIALSPDGKRIYVANYLDDKVSVIDAASGKTLGTIADSGGPAFLAIAPNGKTLYTSNVGSNTVSVITLTATTAPAAPTAAQQAQAAAAQAQKNLQNAVNGFNKNVDSLSSVVNDIENRLKHDVATFNIPALYNVIANFAGFGNDLLQVAKKIGGQLPGIFGQAVAIANLPNTISDLEKNLEIAINGGNGNVLNGTYSFVKALVDVGALTTAVAGLVYLGADEAVGVTIADAFVTDFSSVFIVIDKALGK